MLKSVVTAEDLLRQAQLKAGLGDKGRKIGQYEASIAFGTEDKELVALLVKDGFSFEKPAMDFFRRETWSVNLLTIVDTHLAQEKRKQGSVPLYMFSDDHPRPSDLEDPYKVDPFGIFAPGRVVRIGLTGKLSFLGEEGVSCEAITEVKIDNRYRFTYDFSRLYKVLAESTLARIPPGMRELARNDGKVTWGFADLGFARAKRISALFRKFARGNENLLRLAEHGEVFDPNPAMECNYHGGPRYVLADYDDRFVPFKEQSCVLLGWHKQLEAYRASLLVRP